MRRALPELLLATLLLVGAAFTPSGAEAAARGGKATFARYADSLFLDPVRTDANVDIWILTNIYDTLIEPTDDGLGLKPGLATKWSVSDDGKTVTLTLRPGVKFSDGSPLTANDVIWSLDRAINPDSGPWASLVESIDKITGAGDVITVTLKHPDPSILPALATFNTAILPKKLFEKEAGATSADKAKAFAEHPVGTGPFVLSAWQRGVQITLKRNPNYWKMAEDGKPLPYLDELDLPVIVDDSTRILKLKAGEVDGAEFIPYSRVKELQGDANIRMELWPSTKVTYIQLFCGPMTKDGKPNPLANETVRQALNYATVKPAVIGITTHGLGTPMQSYMSSTTPLFTAQDLYKFDLAKARALMKQAGFEGGFETSVLALSGSADDANTLTTIQQMWSQIGVKLQIEQVDNATRVARYQAEDFKMRAASWTNDIADPNEITSYFAYYPNIHSLHSQWRDPKIDELFQQSQSEMDEHKRAEQYKQIQTLYAAAAPIVFLYQTPYPVAWLKKAKGFVQIPLGNNIFEGVYVER